MAQSEVAICNSALIKLGADRITSLSDNTKEARLCNEQYAKMRDELLSQHFWNFAISRVELSALVDTPAFGYSKYFAVPSDILRVIEVDGDPEWNLEYHDNQRVIATNESQVFIKGIFQVTNTTLFSRMFDDALSWRLAAELSIALSDSASLQENMFQLAQRALSDARAFDAQEGYINRVQASSYINVRR